MKLSKIKFKGIVFIIIILLNFIYMYDRINGLNVMPVAILIMVATITLWLLIPDSLEEAVQVIIILLLMIGVYYLELKIINLELYLQLPSLVRLGIVVSLVVFQPLVILKGINSVWRKTLLVRDSINSLDGKTFSNFWVLFSASIIVLFVFLVASYDRAGVPGWDTPNYVWRSRLIGNPNGLLLHINNYGNGLQLTFSTLASILQTITRIDSWQSVIFLSACLAGLGSFATGLVLYVKEQVPTASLIAILFTAGYLPTARYTADLRDNLSAWCFGTLSMVFFNLSETNQRRSGLFSALSILCLVLTGYSHIAISAIFFLTIMIQALLSYLNTRSLADIIHAFPLKKELVEFLRYVKIPLISAFIVGLTSLPILKTYLLSIQKFGLETSALGASTIGIEWLINNLELFSVGTWALIGFFVILLEHHQNPVVSSLYRLIIIWVMVCVSLFLFLPGRLQYRFFFMIPFPVLVGIGLEKLLDIKLLWPQYVQKIIKTALVVLIIGVTIPFNLANSYKAVNQRSVWVNETMLSYISRINTYVKLNDLKPPFVFIMYKSRDAMAFSVLWSNIVKAQIDRENILDTYVYFGDLSHYLNSEMQRFDHDELNTVSDYWWDLMSVDKIQERKPIVFIVETFNPETFDQYLYDSNVDIISDGVLVVLPR